MDLYVNSDTDPEYSQDSGFGYGNDATEDGASISTPSATIAGALKFAIDNPPEGGLDGVDITIYLANHHTEQYVQPNYETMVTVNDGENSIRVPIMFPGQNKITIVPYGLPVNFYLLMPQKLNDIQYDADTYPLPVLEPLELYGSAEWSLKGLEFSGGTDGPLDRSFDPSKGPFFGIRIQNTGMINIESCRIKNNTYGVFVAQGAVSVIGSLVENNNVGVVSFYNSIASFFGNNVIRNSKEMGLVAALGGTVVVATPVFSGASSGALSSIEITTTEPRKSYAAVKIGIRGQVILDQDIPGTDKRIPGIIRVLRLNEYDHPEYLGVALESMGMLIGSRNVQFRSPKQQFSAQPTLTSVPYSGLDVESSVDLDSIPPERQIVVATEQGAVVIE